MTANNNKTTRKKYGRLIDERNKKEQNNKITDEATVSNHIQRIKQALNEVVRQVEEDIDTTTTEGEGEGS